MRAHGAGTLLGVVGLQQQTPLVSPEPVECADDVLEVHMWVSSSDCSGFEGLKSFVHRLNFPENTSVSVGSLNALPDALHFPKSRVLKRVTPSFATTSPHQNRGENLPTTRFSRSLNHQIGGSAVPKVLFGFGLSFLLFTNLDSPDHWRPASRCRKRHRSSHRWEWRTNDPRAHH